MTGHEMATEVCVWIGVVTAALSALALPLSTELYDRMHYMAPVADISAIAILVAIVLQEGWGQASAKMLFICLVLVIMNAVLSHATARAARFRRFGQWTPQPGEQIRGAAKDEHRQERSQ